jgi:YfiH family protein
MHFVETAGRRYAQFERFRHVVGVVHAFSTRPMDMAPRDGPDAPRRAVHRARMVTDWGLDPARLCYCEQVHETRLVVVDEGHSGGGLPECDGAVTALVGRSLMAFSADCPLVLLLDPVRRVLGLVHASWRCTVARLTLGLVELMSERFGCRPAELRAGVGPGAGPCCYEVQRDVYEAAAGLTDREQCFYKREGRLYFDLWEANRSLLVGAGVPGENIEVAGICTMCRNDVFYSYRREGPGCGHFGLLAALTRGSGG